MIERTSSLFWKEANGILDKGEVKRILVFEGGGIGDLLRVFPAISVLHDEFPQAAISVLASPSAQGVLELFPDKTIISEIFDYDIYGSHKSLLGKLFLILLLRFKRFDLIYAPTRGEGMREIILMAYLTKIPHRIGFRKGRIGYLNTVSIEFVEDLPIHQQNLLLLQACNINIKNGDLRIEVPEKDMAFAKDLIGESDPPKIVSLHPNASWVASYRTWPLKNYIQLIGHIVSDLKVKVIIVGSKNEVKIGDEIQKVIKNPSLINIVGKTTTSQMAAIIKSSHLFIGNDSGPLHIALTVGTPAIGIFGSTAPRQVLSRIDRCFVVKKELPCSPCYLHQPIFERHCNRPTCMEAISWEMVMKPVKKMLFNENI